jgi:tetratricopeptide (TPR) repeat protein
MAGASPRSPGKRILTIMLPISTSCAGSVMLFLSLLALASLTSCGGERDEDRQATTPAMDPALARHLRASDDSTLAAYCQEAGVTVLDEAASIMREQLDACMSGVAGDGRAEEILAPLLRLQEAMALVYDIPCGLVAWRHWQEMSRAERREATRLRLRYFELHGDTSLSLPEREAALRSLLRRFQAFKPHLNDADLLGLLAGICLAQHRPREHRHYTDLALASALEAGRWPYACQVLGVLGTLHQNEGRIDSMRACWDEALRIAHAHRLPLHAARISSFYAHHYRRLGHLALARDLFEEAVELCREYKGRYHELRFVRELIDFYIYLGCWDLADRMLKRAEVLLREHERNPHRELQEIAAYLTAEQRARCEFAAGRTAAAEAIYGRIWHQDMSEFGYQIRPNMMLRRAQDLMDRGDGGRAEAIIAEGLSLARAWPIPEIEQAFWLLQAQVHLARGEAGDCRQALRRHREIVAAIGKPFPEEGFRSDVLEIRLRLATDGPDSVAGAVAMAMANLRRILTSAEASPEAYLVLGRSRELRWLLHRLVGSSPVAGLALEMAWRRAIYDAEPDSMAATSGWDACVRLVRAQLLDQDAERVAADLLRPYLDELAAGRMVHCTYLFRERDLVRWTADSTGVARAVLHVSRTDVAARVRATLADIATPPIRRGNGLAAKTLSGLRKLAVILLPPELGAGRGATARSLLLVTPDAELGLLPFTALDLGDDGYVPLVSLHDLAYLRFWREDAPPADRTIGLIVADPLPTPQLIRRLGPQRRLQGGMEEARFLHDRVPGSILLARESARKRDVLEACGEARFIHFATHVVRDPQMPFFSFIPMTRTEGRDGREDSQLELTDIRSLDLRGCDLVVLAGCSSGAPYIDRRSSAPSLGEAFLDAGAGSVVQTQWAVSDRDAARYIKVFILDHFVSGIDPVRSLNSAQRMLMEADAGDGAHPFTWAPYQIVLSCLPERTRARVGAAMAPTRSSRLVRSRQ